MDWTELLESEMGIAYGATAGLIKMVDDKSLGWKPSTGTNWLTTGQLLLHLSSACGSGFRGFITGEWKDDGVAPDYKPEKEGMLPPAEKYLAVKSVGEALQKLEGDKALSMKLLRQAGEKDLAKKKVAAPWGGPEMLLGKYLLMMVDHLKNHKAQLFYYLKLQGKPVSTQHLYGM